MLAKAGSWIPATGYLEKDSRFGLTWGKGSECWLAKNKFKTDGHLREIFRVVATLERGLEW